jgi:lipopolysaccharide/colanic/teichoic acid biosynthesis glycosyltransferase
MTDGYPNKDAKIAFTRIGNWGDQIGFGKPFHIEGFAFGFLFRFLTGFFAVLGGCALLFVWALFFGWYVNIPMLVVLSIYISVAVFFAEHIRSRVYERFVEYQSNPIRRKLVIDETLEQIEAQLDKGSPKIFSLILKRGFDFIFSIISIFVVSPLFIAAAVSIKLDSRGPIFFRQRRYGFNGKEIKLVKFRTMNVDTHEVTRVGRILRLTNIDELPQILNVLVGEMSVVGPRPSIYNAAEQAQFDKVVSNYALRYYLKPGITGWAQVNGYRGGLPNRDIKERAKLDLWYIDNWSLSLDFLIIGMSLVHGSVMEELVRKLVQDLLGSMRRSG